MRSCKVKEQIRSERIGRKHGMYSPYTINTEYLEDIGRIGLEPSRDGFLKVVTSSILKTRKISPIFEKIILKNESTAIIAWIKCLVGKVQSLSTEQIYLQHMEDLSKNGRIDSVSETALYILDALQIPCQPIAGQYFHQNHYPRALGTNFFAEMTYADMIYNISERIHGMEYQKLDDKWIQTQRKVSKAQCTLFIEEYERKNLTQKNREILFGRLITSLKKNNYIFRDDSLETYMKLPLLRETARLLKKSNLPRWNYLKNPRGSTQPPPGEGGEITIPYGLVTKTLTGPRSTESNAKDPQKHLDKKCTIKMKTILGKPGFSQHPTNPRISLLRTRGIQFIKMHDLMTPSNILLHLKDFMDDLQELKRCQKRGKMEMFKK